VAKIMGHAEHILVLKVVSGHLLEISDKNKKIVSLPTLTVLKLVLNLRYLIV
jgi:hypothetical protein